MKRITYTFKKNALNAMNAEVMDGLIRNYHVKYLLYKWFSMYPQAAAVAEKYYHQSEEALKKIKACVLINKLATKKYRAYG